MNCGIYACIALLNDLNVDTELSINYLNKCLNNKGVSLLDLKNALIIQGVDCRCMYNKKPIIKDKLILYDSKRKHFYYLKEVRKHMVIIDDVNLKEFKLFKLFYYLIWPKYYLEIDV